MDTILGGSSSLLVLLYRAEGHRLTAAREHEAVDLALWAACNGEVLRVQGHVGLDPLQF